MTNFIVLGTINAITYKEFFLLIKEGKVKTGTVFNKTLQFRAPSGELKDMIGIAWFTTFAVENKKPLLLTAKYDPEKYPHYDNYDAIEVGKVENIPADYDGVMGVPITFLHKYCPSQFEIVDINPHFFSLVEQGFEKPKQLSLKSYGMKDPYARILIRKRTENNIEKQ